MLQQFGRNHFARGKLTHNALVACADIMQVASFGEHVRLSQCQTAACLLEINPSTDSGLDALLNLVENLLVLGEIFLCQS